MSHAAGAAGVTGSEVARRLQACGIRSTEQRLRIAKVLLAAPQHLSAEQITEALEGSGGHVSKATVYNTLNLFAKHGLIRQLNVDGSIPMLRRTITSTIRIRGSSVTSRCLRWSSLGYRRHRRAWNSRVLIW